MKSSFKENFNFVTNILIIFLLLISGFVWADNNGVWTLASDIRGGIIGSDEQVPNMNYSFINSVNFFNPVYFYNKLRSNDNNYYINISGRTQLNDLATQKIASNQGFINGNLSISSVSNCSGKLYTDSTGKVLCDNSNINGADSSPTNELQTISKSGNIITLSKGGGSVIDTDTNAATICGPGTFLNGDGSCDTVPVDTDTRLSEAQVDAYADNNGYLKAGFSGDLIADNTVDNSEIQDGTLTSTDTNINSIQKRVTGTCPAGSSIRAISNSGAVTCETDDTGSVSPGVSIYNCGSTTLLRYGEGSGPICDDVLTTSSVCYQQGEHNDIISSCAYVGKLVN